MELSLLSLTGWLMLINPPDGFIVKYNHGSITRKNRPHVALRHCYDKSETITHPLAWAFIFGLEGQHQDQQEMFTALSRRKLLYRIGNFGAETLEKFERLCGGVKDEQRWTIRLDEQKGTVA